MVNAWRNISPAKAVGALPPQKTSHQKAIEQRPKGRGFKPKTNY